MPFIDDDLLWCQEQGKTMTELTNLSCLDTTITLVSPQPTPVEGTLTELSHTDLTGLAPAPEAEESEDLLRSLNDSHLDNIESIFADLEPQGKNLENLTILGDLPPRRRKRRKSADSTSHLTSTLHAEDTFQNVSKNRWIRSPRKTSAPIFPFNETEIPLKLNILSRNIAAM